MSALDCLLLKYEKNGYWKVSQKDLKSGTRICLEKKVEGFLTDTTNHAYFYYIKGDASIENLRDAIKDYEKFFKGKEFGKGDKGFCVISGFFLGSKSLTLFSILLKSIISSSEESSKSSDVSFSSISFESSS